MSRTLRAAIYTRISRDREGTSLGVARQQKLCEKIAEALGVEVMDVFTGWKRNRRSRTWRD